MEKIKTDCEWRTDGIKWPWTTKHWRNHALLSFYVMITIWTIERLQLLQYSNHPPPYFLSSVNRLDKRQTAKFSSTACNLQTTSPNNYSGTPPHDHPVNTTTPLLRPLFCDPNKNPLIFLSEDPLIRPPRYYDQRPPFGVPSRYFLYKITPLIRPVKIFGETAEWKQTQSDK